MKIVIVGASGLVGTELTKQLSPSDHVVALGHDALDITNASAVTRVITDERPALLINCAAAGVDACEADPLRANQVNVVGAENIARAASVVDAALVHFSTNYVFDGNIAAGSSYTDDCPTCPVNEYGRTKAAGEQAVLAGNDRSFIVRTSWVFGPGKESFLSTLPHSLHNGTKVRAITDIFANSTYVRDLVERVREIVSRQRYGTYHVVNAGVCSFAEFAFEAARLLGIHPTAAASLIETRELRDFNFAARRPAYTPMVCRLSNELGLPPMREWRLALADYIQARGLFGNGLRGSP